MRNRFLKIVWLIIIASVLVGAWAIVAYIFEQEQGSLQFPRDAERIFLITIYDIDGSTENNTRIDDLVEQSTIEGMDIKPLLRNAVYHSSLPIWKGSRFAVMQLENGATVPISICIHGPYFKIHTSSGYYEVKGSYGKEFSQSIRNIIVKKFIPAREKRNHAMTQDAAG